MCTRVEGCGTDDRRGRRLLDVGRTGRASWCMTVYAHGRLDEKAAALSQLGVAVAGALPSAVAVTADENDQPESVSCGSGGI
jgi:hypothetical protein